MSFARRRSPATIAAAVGACLLWAASAHANLASNPGFEWGTTAGWAATGGTLAASTSQAHAGAYSGKISARTSAAYGPKIDLLSGAVTGAKYSFSCYVRMDSANDTVYLKVYKKDSGTTTTTVATGSATTSGWVNLSGSFNLSVSGTLTSLYAYVCTNTTTTAFYTDDMAILLSPPNGGFEGGNTTSWGASGCSLGASTAQKYSGAYSGLTSSRTAATSGPTRSVASLMSHGKTYRVSCWVRMNTGDGSEKVRLNIRQDDDVRDDTRCVQEAFVSDTAWTQIQGVVHPILSGTLTAHDIVISGPPAAKNFFVDDLYVTEIRDMYDARLSRISQFRAADALITCTNAQGQPLSGATVEIIQRNKSYPLGSAISEPAVNNLRYQDFFRKHFNYAAIEDSCNWPQNEASQDVLGYDLVSALLDWTEDHNILSRWTAVFWGEECSYGSNIQPWLKNLTGAQVHAEMQERVSDVVDTFEGRIDNWTVMNESLYDGSSTYSGYDCSWFTDKTGDPDTDADMYVAVRNHDAYTRPLLVNNFNIINTGAYISQYKTHVADLVSRGATIDAIGVQCHMEEAPNLSTHLPRFDSVAQMGRPIWVTEYDYEVADDASRAANLEQFLYTAYSHPFVKGIILWGFWEPCMSRNDSHLVNTDWTVNAAGTKWENIMNAWTSSVSRTTGADGKAAIRGYFGEYSVIVTPSGGSAQEFVIDLADSSAIADSPLHEFTIQIGQGVAEDIAAPTPASFSTNPTALDEQAIRMVANTATDAAGNGVEYYFDCTAGAGGHDSGWRESPVYVDYGLAAGTQYAYRVKVRDTSVNYNESGYSGTASATTYASNTNKLANAGFEWGDAAGWNRLSRCGYSACRTYDTAVKRTGLYSMKVGNRFDSSFGADQDLAAPLTNGKAYRCTAYVRMAPSGTDALGLHMWQSQTGAPATRDVDLDADYAVSDNAWTELTGVFPYDLNGTLNALTFYVAGASAGRAFYIDDCSVTEIANKVSSNSGFESGGTTGWSTTGGAALAASNVQAHTGTYSGRMSSRTATWQGPYRDLMGTITSGRTYTFYCWVKMDSTNDAVYLTLVKQDDSNGGSPTYTTVSSGSATTGGWLLLSGSQTITVTGTLDMLGVYVQTGSTTTDFYTDNLIVEEQ